MMQIPVTGCTVKAINVLWEARMVSRRQGTNHSNPLPKLEAPTLEAEVVSEPVAQDHSELTTKIEELQHALEGSQQKERILQEMVDQLQLQLDEQQEVIQKLQTSVEKANHLQTELEQAQKTALKLAETNQKLIEESNARTQAEAAEKTQSSQLAQAQERDLRSQQEVMRQRQAARLSHPVFPDNPMPSELDIGWAD
jgi:chromosome segregation ATPase